MQNIYRLILIAIICMPNALWAQDADEAMLKKIYDEALTGGKTYEMLDYLSNEIGARLSGSPEAAAAVEWSKQEMMKYGFDTVFLQPVMVPHWVRGVKEIVKVTDAGKYGSFELNACALGNSVGTGNAGVWAEVVEVRNFEELKKLGKKNIQGKIVFFSRPMQSTLLDPFEAYSGAVDQRAFGPSKAAALGAVAVVVRSMAINNDDIPHTGGLRYDDDVKKIPAVAISTNDAEKLSSILKDKVDAKLYIETHCEMLPDVLSYNVVGEMRGTEKSNEYIVVGGHLDSWDLGDGSHDDGAGCVQSIEVLRLLKELGYKNKHTIRAVMYMNEENGLKGGIEYAKLARENKEKHIAAIESDRGGFTPIGFTSDNSKTAVTKLKAWSPLLLPYGLYDFSKKGSGADISPLADQGVALFEFLPDPQRYFNYHHTTADTFDKIDKRELELGAAAMTTLVYLIDQHGL